MTAPEEMQTFIDDFRCQKAASVLKKIFFDTSGLDNFSSMINKSPREGDQPVDTAAMDAANPIVDLNNYIVNSAVLWACYNVLERLLKPFEDGFIDDPKPSEDVDVVTSLEWEVLTCCDDIHKSSQLSDVPLEPVDSFLKNNEEASSKSKLNRKKSEKYREFISQSIRRVVCLTDKDFLRIKNILLKLQRVEAKQFGINGYGSKAKNLWIVKPAAKSRGRGWFTHNQSQSLLIS